MIVDGAVIEHELWDEAVVIADADSALTSTLAERISGLPARRRRTLAKAGRAGGWDRAARGARGGAV